MVVDLEKPVRKEELLAKNLSGKEGNEQARKIDGEIWQ
jgi:hypothetical protein